MDMKKKKISEKDYVGRFLLQLKHTSIFGYSGKIEKCIVQCQFRDYVKENPFLNINAEKLEMLLLKHEFLFNAKNITKTNIFTINMVKLRQYSKDLLKRLDETQKQEMTKRITLEYPLGEFKEAENLRVDPDFEEEELKFKTNYIENEDKKFVPKSEGCCICQKNFESEIDYLEHIEYHTQKSNFESLLTKNQGLTPFVRISYQMCKNSSILHFCIQNLQSDLDIYKVVLVRETSMLYPQDSDTPYTLSPRQQSYFYIDCHTFEIGHEQPIIIIFKDGSAIDATKMRVEQHHFLRLEPFNVEMANAVDQYIPKQGSNELSCTANLDDYLPPSDLKESEISTIYNKCPRFLEYERSNKIIDQENIQDIYKLLLQLEDIAILDLYEKLTQKETTVSSCGAHFSVMLDLEYDINLEDILKEGDKVELFDSIRSRFIYGSVEKVSKKRIIFSVKYSHLVDIHKLYKVMFRPLRYNLILQYRALGLLKSRRNVMRILFPAKKLYTNEKATISISAYNENLAKNPEQLQAVERIVHHMDSEAPYIIFGPPGTGKTTTIVEAIYQLWKHNPENRILVVGGSNACVDEIAVRLLEVFKEVDPLGKNMLRIYSSVQGKKSGYVDETLIKVSNVCHGYQFYPNLHIVYKFPIVFATLAVAAIYIHGGLATGHFSHVFVDECGASTEPEVITTLIGTVTPTTKVIFAGDPKQLGPVLQSKTAEQLGLGVSLLERLMNLECYQVEPESKAYDRSRQIRLTKNFRTHPAILHMSNKLYNALEACGGKSVTSWALAWYNLPSPNFPVIFHPVNGKCERREGSQSLYNWAEMLVVMNYIKEIMYFGINGRKMEPYEIGVVTPYKSQVNLIRMELDARKWFGIEVGSVEKFQGQERPVIVFSTVRSRTRSLGFLVSPKRLNVSLTRPQALLIIVGNPETLAASPDFKYVIKYCEDNGVFKRGKNSSLRNGSYSEDLMNEFDNLSISNKNSDMEENHQEQQN